MARDGAGGHGPQAPPPLGKSGRRWRLVRARREAVPATVRRIIRASRGSRAAGQDGAGQRGLGQRGPGQRGVGQRRPWRGGVALGSIAAVALGAAAWVVLGTSTLGVRQVRVVGAEIAGAEAVRAAAAVPPGTPLARLDTDAISQRVRALPPVASAEVRRSWPHTLVIEVTERTPVAAVSRDGSYHLLDASGVIFHRVAKRPAGLVLIEIATPGPDDPATRAALRVVAALTPALRERVTVLVAQAPHRLRLELAGGGVVIWGDAENSERKAQVATTLLAEAGGKTIDVSAPDVVTVS